MPLPTKMKFPPNGDAGRLYRLHNSWYAGDPNSLEIVHRELAGAKFGTSKNSFWGKQAEEGLVKMHIPIASDIANTSADMLFAEIPDFTIPEAEKANSGGAVKSQERMMEIVNDGGIASRLLEASEMSSAMGGVFLVPTWDRSIADFPILGINQVDNAIPEFKWGILVAVTFWKVLAEDNGVYWRHLERHESGKIYNGLYKGTKDDLGAKIPLPAHPATADLQEEISTGWEGLMVRYIPNMKPNRRFRGSSLGQSDYAGIESLMDQLDEVYTSWMRDVRLARGRILVPEVFLDFDAEDKKQGPAFNVDQSVFVAYSSGPLAEDAGGSSIQAVQFDIRTEEHKNTAIELLERIVSSAGYSPQTFGLHTEGRAESGTALNIRERKSFITRAKKFRYWKQPLEDIMEMMMFIDREHLGNRNEVLKPTVKMNDSMNTDVATMSNAVKTLNDAQAVSIDTKVRMIHPDWSEEEIQAEIKSIKDEQGVTVPNPEEELV